MIKKLKQLGILGAIRGRCGYDENDESYDEKINKMSPKKLIGLYSGWVLGDEGWFNSFINKYEYLKGDEK